MPTAFGAPGWVVTDSTLRAVDAAGFRYASDCRGTSPFLPEGMRTPQLPTTLPTLEEIVRAGGTMADLWTNLEAEVGKRTYSCYCAHAEVEGMRFPEFLPRFLDRVQGMVTVGPLGDALADQAELPVHRVAHTLIPGRFDSVASQVTA
ncbi:MAG: hypothetical protein MUE60_10305, partial [Candidatus Eisenbacteria bacterium]|nr:hypothetical protein [Candidatus Eisenbacteria bacterium]